MAKLWYVYLIRCADDSIYCGVTTHLKHRIARHNDGTASKYTRARRPVSFIIAKYGFNRSDALKMEYRIKQMKKLDKIPFMEKL
jgi:putative endonuclease